MTLSAAARAIAALMLLAGIASAQDRWPARPVRIVVPFPPGGSVDPLARLAASKLSESLGRPFLVENKPGASGAIGTAFAAKSAPDGYTFVLVFDSHAVNPSLIKDLQYDTHKDFAPVMLVGTAPLAIATSKPFASFEDVIRAAKAKPGAVNFGTIGSFGLAHLTMTVLQHEGRFRLLHVPYKGGGPMTLDAVSGQIDLALASVALFLPLARANKLTALSVTGARRSTAMPNVPTLAEQGFPGFSVLSFWAFLAPAGTPPPIVERLHAELAAIFSQPEVRRNLTDQLGMEVTASSPEATQAFIAAEIELWAKVVREHNIKAE